MKLMIASDIHGSAKWCQKLLDRFEEESPEKILLLGDILYHGPRNDFPDEYAPKKVIKMLNDIKDSIMCIRGNCDTEVDQMVLEFPIMSTTMSLFLDGHFIYVSHGHVENPDNPPYLTKKQILLNGHTHVAMCKEYDNFIYMNPGSVSIPKNETKRGYMIYENHRFEWKDLEGNSYMKYDMD